MASKLPHVDLALVEYLEKMNPDKFPDYDYTPWQLGRKSGAIEIVRHLRRLYEDQVKSSLTAGFAKD